MRYSHISILLVTRLPENNRGNKMMYSSKLVAQRYNFSSNKVLSWREPSEVADSLKHALFWLLRKGSVSLVWHEEKRQREAISQSKDIQRRWRITVYLPTCVWWACQIKHAKSILFTRLKRIWNCVFMLKCSPSSPQSMQLMWSIVGFVRVFLTF